MNTLSTSISGGGETDSYERCSPWKVYPSWQYDSLVQQYGDRKVKLVFIQRHAEGTHNVNKDYKSIEQVDARLTKIGKEQCQKLQNKLISLKDKAENIDTKSDNIHCDRKKIVNTHEQGLEYLIGTQGGDDDVNSDICVVVSPLTRCIQTALLSFDFLTSDFGIDCNSNSIKRKTIPFVGLEALRETVNYSCDRRRRIFEIADEFPQIDFSLCPNDEDEIWMSYRRREQSELSSMSNKDEPETTTIKRNHSESAELYAVAKRGRQALEFLQSLPQTKLILCTHSAYLRCILNWGQTGGVSKMWDQWLDDEEHYMRQEKLFDYCYSDISDEDENNDSNEKPGQCSFEEYMRKDYENAELRSFCLLVH